jgi:7,8-dihydropterin-6-yl-methyl-4-(beta-D-ribofuranosyl)aminobenzene 5'-phosphate synthase
VRPPPTRLDAGARPTVYVPAVFPASFKNSVLVRTDLVEVTGPMEIRPGLHTTGEVGSAIVEQALAVETEDGLVVVTGCAHPGVVEMVDRAIEVFGGDVLLVVGGFHLGSATQGQIEGVIDGFRHLGVRTVAPCHCTGDQARQLLAESFGSDHIEAGVGRVITIGGGGTE